MLGVTAARSSEPFVGTLEYVATTPAVTRDRSERSTTTCRAPWRLSSARKPARSGGTAIRLAHVDRSALHEPDERVVERHHAVLAAAFDRQRQLRRLAFGEHAARPPGVFSSTSRAATRPPPFFLSSTWTTTPRRFCASDSCTCRRCSGGYRSMMRSMAPLALCAGKPPMTSWPRRRGVERQRSSAPASAPLRAPARRDPRAAPHAPRPASRPLPPRTSRWLMKRAGPLVHDVDLALDRDDVIAARAVDQIHERRR